VILLFFFTEDAIKKKPKNTEEIMREKTIDGITFEISPLTRGHRKKLRAEGVDVNQITEENCFDVQDRVFGLTTSPADRVDELAERSVQTLWGEVLAETFGDPDETKN
jgi:hypothetical protein